MLESRRSVVAVHVEYGEFVLYCDVLDGTRH
jgi:hypothetical protein